MIKSKPGLQTGCMSLETKRGMFFCSSYLAGGKIKRGGGSMECYLLGSNASLTFHFLRFLSGVMTCIVWLHQGKALISTYTHTPIGSYSKSSTDLHLHSTFIQGVQERETQVYGWIIQKFKLLFYHDRVPYFDCLCVHCRSYYRTQTQLGKSGELF